VAHDLQNPLSAIALASRAAQREDMPAQDREEFLEEIASTAYKMSEIIESLMLLAETRTRDVPGECLDMKVIIESVTRRMSRQISASKAMVYLPDEWPVAIGYGPWIEEVWSNYLSNALKYGGRPPRIELGADEPIGGHVRFWVKDYGQGLSPEEQARLFQPFTRLRNISGGHGLGLSIVKRVVERLGGQVGVESTPGKGSVFFFTLPTHERMEIGEMAAALRPI
jgi:two-component system sensor histidine kinase/response regulator